MERCSEQSDRYCYIVFSTTNTGHAAGRKVVNGEPAGAYGWVPLSACVLLFQSEKEAWFWGSSNIGHPVQKGWEVMRVFHNDECVAPF